MQRSSRPRRTMSLREAPALVQLTMGLQQIYRWTAQQAARPVPTAAAHTHRTHHLQQQPQQQTTPQDPSRRPPRSASAGSVPTSTASSSSSRTAGTNSNTHANATSKQPRRKGGELANETARRILTKKTRPSGNGGLDNEEQNLIVSARDILGGREATPMQSEFIVLDMLGQGTFGQVFRCQNVDTKEIVAIKVIRNHPSYYKQAVVEVQITRLLNASYSEDEAPHLVRLLDTFEFRNHLCLIFELLSINLYELIAENNFNGFPLTITRGFLHQMLLGLVQLEEVGVIHCDLKPENILLAGQDKFMHDPLAGRDPLASTSIKSSPAAQIPFIKLVDFGSACQENETVYSYIQSRFYRSPEVLLGIPYTGAIDLWSLGCIAVEMFLGLPLFPGVSEHDQLRLIEETLGKLPQELLRQGRNVMKFFRVSGNSQFVLKTPAEFARDTNAEVQMSKKYFKYTELDDMVHAYPYPKHATQEQIRLERDQRDSFLHFVRGLLCVDPTKRWTARDAMLHPFMTGSQFVKEEVEFTQSVGRHSRSHSGARYGVSVASSPATKSQSWSQERYYNQQQDQREWPGMLPEAHGGRPSPYAVSYGESIWGPSGMPPYAAGPMPRPDPEVDRSHHATREVRSSKVAPVLHSGESEDIYSSHEVYAPLYHESPQYVSSYAPQSLGYHKLSPPQSISSSEGYPVVPLSPYYSHDLDFHGQPTLPELHSMIAPPEPVASYYVTPTTDQWSKAHQGYQTYAVAPETHSTRRGKRLHTSSWDSNDTRGDRKHEQRQPRYAGGGDSTHSIHTPSRQQHANYNGVRGRGQSTPRRGDGKGKATTNRTQRSPRKQHRHQLYHRDGCIPATGNSTIMHRDDSAPSCSVEGQFGSSMGLAVATAAVPLPT